MSIMGRYQQGSLNSNNINDNNITTTDNVIMTPINIVPIKVVTIGNSSVGKTSIIKRLINNSFDTSANSTIGCAFNTLVKEDNNNIYRFQIWDTAGQERFRSLVPMYINNSNIVLLIYDITSPESFEEIKKHWYDAVRKLEPRAELVLVGNKVDLDWSRRVFTRSAREYAESKGIPYVECSALNKNGLDNLQNIMMEIGNRISNLPPEPEDNIITVNNENNENILEKWGCNNVRCVM